VLENGFSEPEIITLKKDTNYSGTLLMAAVSLRVDLALGK